MPSYDSQPLSRPRRAHVSIAAWFAPCSALRPLAVAHEIELASIETARAMLGARDEFVARLSPFDRAARLKSGTDVAEAEYLAFATAAGREWSNDERARLTAAFAAIEPKLAELLPELDEPILLVKTSGEEEGGAGYTRANAVMLPQAHDDDASCNGCLRTKFFMSRRATIRI